jgi:hypothetical protein
VFLTDCSMAERGSGSCAEAMSSWMLGGGKHTARTLRRAQILLAADAGQTDGAIADDVSVGLLTVYRTKRCVVLDNLEAAVTGAPRPGAARKLSDKRQALLVATACANPPAGRRRWTLELLADERVQVTDHETLSRETVRRCLAENDLEPWRRDMWCVPEFDGTYVARMEDLLDLYAEKPDPQHPVICFDERPTQLIGETGQPLPGALGQPERYDCEYRRNGTANLFVFVDAHRPWREVKVTDRRTAADFAHCMRRLAEIHYLGAKRIRVVMDNLSTHTAGALYETFTPPEAHRLLECLEFRHTPKHASWLNMVEIGVLCGQCLNRRIGERQTLITEIGHRKRPRTAARARIKWMFTTARARDKLARP